MGIPPGTPPDPALPAVVVVHGINPFNAFMHFRIAERYGEAVGARWGASITVLGWDWNGNTLNGLRPSRNEALAESQGRALADALLRAGVAPERLHLVGHSSGGLAAAAAARSLADRTGRPIDRLTLLDPAERQHASDLRGTPGRLRGASRQPLLGDGALGFRASCPPAQYPRAGADRPVGPAWTG